MRGLLQIKAHESLGSNDGYLEQTQPVFSLIKFREKDPVCFFSKYKKLLKEDSYLDKIGSVDDQTYNRLCSFKHAVLFILNEHSRENSCICLDNFISSNITVDEVNAYLI